MRMYESSAEEAHSGPSAGHDTALSPSWCPRSTCFGWISPPCTMNERTVSSHEPVTSCPVGDQQTDQMFSSCASGSDVARSIELIPPTAALAGESSRDVSATLRCRGVLKQKDRNSGLNLGMVPRRVTRVSSLALDDRPTVHVFYCRALQQIVPGS